MVLGIIGQRELDFASCEGSILNAISFFNPSKVISGGANGVDSHVRSICKALELPFSEYLPDLSNLSGRADVIKRYHARNDLIVNACDVLVAIIGERNTGGSHYTIRKARSVGKKVVIVHLCPPRT